MAEVRASVEKDGVQISVQAHGDADVDLWAAKRKVELFESVFGREVFFSAAGSSGTPLGKGTSRTPRTKGTGRSTNGKSKSTTKRNRPARTKRTRPR